MTHHLASVAMAGAQAVAFKSEDRMGNALYDMSWSAIQIPFLLLTNLVASKLFTPSVQEKEHPLGAKKISTYDDLGDVALKTTVAIAAFAPITLLAKYIAKTTGYENLKSVQQPLAHQMIGNAALSIVLAIGTHLLGCLFDAVEMTTHT